MDFLLLPVNFCRYSQSANSGVSIANTVQAFITTMDSLKLNMAAVDQVMYKGLHLKSQSCFAAAAV